MADLGIHIGSVTGVNPAKRELRVKVLRGRAHEFEKMDWIRVVLREGREMRCRVASLRQGNKNTIVMLAPGVTRDNVARMKGGSIVVLESEQKSRPDWQLDASQLVELDVHADDGRFLGTVVEAFETGANAVLEVEKPDGAILLVPAIEAVIADVDWNEGRIVVHELAPYIVDDDEENRPRLA